MQVGFIIEIIIGGRGIVSNSYSDIYIAEL